MIIYFMIKWNNLCTIIIRVIVHSGTEHYKKYDNLNYKGYYGGYKEIDTNNNDKIKVIHMSKNKLKGISNRMTIGKK